MATKQKIPQYETLTKDALNIIEYEEFLSDWHEFADIDPKAAADTETSKAQKLIAGIEQRTAKALNRLVEHADHGGYAFQANAQFLAFQCGAILVERSGVIIQANDQAARQFQIEDSYTIDQLNLILSDNRLLSEALKPAFSDSKASLDLVTALNTQTDQNVTLAILHLSEGTADGAQSLIIIVDAPWTSNTTDLIGARFGLTSAECEIINTFAQGHSLKSIAEIRGKSYTTVRNQFQAVLEKTGCSNQIDLLRMLLGTSQLLTQLETLTPAARECNQRDVNLIRPRKRFAEVKLVGDLSGRPFIFIPSVFGHLTTPAIEAALVERSLLMISNVPPGYGGTTQPSNGQSLDQCFVDDVIAVLDNMDIKQCPVMGRAASARTIFNLLSEAPLRLTAAYIVNGVVPSRYFQRNTITSKWAQSLFSAAKHAPGVASLILGTGGRLMLRNGTESFIRRMYANSPVDQKIIGDPEVAKCIRDGVLMVIQQGPEAGIKDMIRSYDDWSPLADRVNTPVTLIHGTDDPNTPLCAVKKFVDGAPGKRTLIEIAGGGLVNYSHVNEIFDLILHDISE